MKHGSSTYLESHRSMPQRLVLLLCFVVCSLGAFAQSKVSGTVVDATGAPIIGASVVIKGSSAGAVTDMDGRWTVDKVPAGSTLVISYVGFKTQEIPVNGRSSIDVKLQED
ncbi:MAG: carboxypeptidase-like regulatory domain-containing protein, partial [Prevotella sp.]|nr:carboxypeptidase-like regulatory domain-containing protein [Prevotella sp.]